VGEDDDDDSMTYKVVVNHEEQYSIWPAYRDNPGGWRDEGRTGTRRECLDHIGQIWTDMRPLSLRKAMDAAAGPTHPTADSG
jgi:MbtH protein